MKPYNCFLPTAVTLAMLAAVCLAQTGGEAPAPTNVVPQVSSDSPAPVALEPAPVAEAEGDIYVIPIKGVFERSMLYTVRRGLNEVRQHENAAVVFAMDTPGGMVFVMEEIVRLIMALPEGIKTYTIVEQDALSAGALMALATDHIYMTPASRIGASAVIQGTGKDLEGDVREKHFAAVISLVKSAAESAGHDGNIVEAMVRKEYEYKIGDKVICPKGQLLVLNDKEAEEVIKDGDKTRRILSDGTVKGLDDLLGLIKTDNSKVITLEVTWSEKLASKMELAAGVFFLVGILALYSEFHTPGFGLSGALGVISLAIGFWGYKVAGLAGAEEVLIFIVGVALLLLEIFVIPGFGIAGVSGIILVFTGLFMAMVQHIPGGNWFKLPPLQISNALRTMSIAVIGSFIGAIILARYLPTTKFFSRIALGKELTADSGFQSADGHAEFVGMRGETETPLHPGGIALIGNKRLDVVTRGEFIDKGSKVKVTEVHGRRIVVDLVEEA